MIRQRLPVLVRCQHLVHDHQHQYGCLAKGRGPCEPITAGPDLSSCPMFQGPTARPTPARPTPADDDDLTEYCPCSGAK